MTTTMSSKGQIVIPQAIRERQKLVEGDEFLILVSRTGDLLLRPRRKPKLSLAEHFRRLQGIDLRRGPNPVPKDRFA